MVKKIIKVDLPKIKVSKIDALKEIMRAWGLNPDELLVKDAQAEPHRIIVGELKAEHELLTLRNAFKEILKRELFDST
ncbi:MAG: hypothetical protein ABIH76_07125 [Candidatus Bathyarchaeota archaeon]